MFLRSGSQILYVSRSGLALNVQSENDTIDVSGVQVLGHDKQFFISNGSYKSRNEVIF